MLPMTSNGPINAAYENAAYDLKWAHSSCLKMLPMTSNGPIIDAA
jgi:hypothetical protein